MSKTVTIFVYGTLKRGFPLHERGLAGARYLGRARTVQRYPMHIAGPWFGPMMLDEPGGGHRVEGELFEVEEARMPRLDELESVGEPGNIRREMDVEPAGGGPPIRAQAWPKTREAADPIHDGPHASYDDDRFVPPEARPKSAA